MREREKKKKRKGVRFAHRGWGEHMSWLSTEGRWWGHTKSTKPQESVRRQNMPKHVNSKQDIGRGLHPIFYLKGCIERHLRGI